MSKFKKGDKVRYLGPSTHMMKVGHIYTVNKYWRGSYGDGDFLRVEEALSTCIDHSLHAYHFELSDERQQLSDAIDLLAKYGVHRDRWGNVWNPATEIAGKEDLLNHLFPTETPAQKKLKELEQQQLEIVAEMEKLRNSM